MAIYTHRDPKILLEHLDGKKIHKAEEIPIYTFSGTLLNDLKALLEKRMKMSISISEKELYIDLAGASLSATIQSQAIPK